MSASAKPVQEGWALTLLHVNDVESQLVDAGSGLEDFGGVARAAARIDAMRTEAAARGRETLLLAAGDNVLVGPQLAVSLERGGTSFDAIALGALGIDALVLGNHDFDLGPAWLASFVASVPGAPPFVSANLDLHGFAPLTELERAGRLRPSVLLPAGDHRVGVIGLTTPELGRISTPGGVRADPELALHVRREVARLDAAGADLIVLLSHLQGLDRDLELARRLRGVDVIVAGGGDELLGDAGGVLVEGDRVEDGVSYPMWAEDADGVSIPVVTTPGELRYVGRLELRIEADGGVGVEPDGSGLVRVAALPRAGGVVPDAALEATVVEPLRRALAEMSARTVALAEVPLEGRRHAVRTTSTNLGDLVADALRAAGRRARPAGAAEPVVSLTNGGGIRSNRVLATGPITLLDTHAMLPFPGVVVVFPELPAARLAALLEHGLGRVELAEGRFPQVAGLQLRWDPSRAPRDRPLDGSDLSRLRELWTDGGERLVRDGRVVPGASPVTLVTTSFVARGGDGYPLEDLVARSLVLTPQEALRRYLAEDLGGVVPASRYGVGRTAPRISALPVRSAIGP